MLSRAFTSGLRKGARGFAARPSAAFDVVVVGGGTGGISTASSLLNRRPDLNICIVEPKEQHFYQPGWTLVGAGVFKQSETVRTTESVMPANVKWIKSSVKTFQPNDNQVALDDGQTLAYKAMVAAPGLKLNWSGVKGLSETLGKNGVTSNYSWDHAPYTWELVQKLKSGRAIFTQSPMPIKCAGAPQKALYLSCDYWKQQGVLSNIEVEFNTATPGLFGVADFVPALKEYIKKYNVNARFQTNLTAVDGPAQKATFTVTDADGKKSELVRDFDMLHVCPPQCAPDFIRSSPLAEKTPQGWVEVDQATLQHVRFPNVFGMGDACSAPNAKTAAAVRKQAPTVAENLISVLDGKQPNATYDGYGACPLITERGKALLAEFGFGGKLLPTFPRALVEGRQATRAAYILKKDLMPWIYYNFVLKGREWFAKPGKLA